METLLFLVVTYWPYLAVALLVGLVTGWLSFTVPERR